MDKFNCDRTMKLLLWTACFKADLEHRICGTTTKKMSPLNVFTERNPGADIRQSFTFSLNHENDLLEPPNFPTQILYKFTHTWF